MLHMLNQKRGQNLHYNTVGTAKQSRRRAMCHKGNETNETIKMCTNRSPTEKRTAADAVHLDLLIFS